MRTRTPRLIAGSIVLLICAMVLLLADARHTAAPRVSSVRQAPTATLAPTPTQIPTPTATPMAGFNLYVDSASGFEIQFPLKWQCTANRVGGVDCLDSPQTPSYVVQVLLPSAATAVGVSGDPNDARVWVQYGLNVLRSQNSGYFQELADPPPPIYFGGATWESGGVLLTQSDPPARAEIYATVHNGRPYVISIFAWDDQFASGVIAYFNPMLQSFAFLPETA